MLDKHFGKVYRYILDKIDNKQGMIFLVIDPPNQSPETAGKLAKIAEQAEIAAIAVGGSVGAQGALLDNTIQQIKENCSLPVILFPGNIATLSPKADAIYFMSMLNSLDPYYITGAQIASSYPIKKMGIEVIPTSYIIVEPGRAAGWVGRAKLIPRELPYLAAVTALAGQYMGSHLAILEAGGGASEHVPLEMISQTKQLINIPLVVAGGVKTPKQAGACIKAGADIVHVGTAIENVSNNFQKAKKRLEALAKAAAKAGKEKGN
ncbi:MAG: geranylgeranylglyceryl/heptaprenylglyceryl phosphate synthase [Candidatus Iainarchaeum archaeon]|uniref:Geranylgeranylglyceryl phosphate synthase n=1 Tax=Candidatus Iainarchaeum sp. TaxID=3101447 RepID=A0A497JG86_9ARCH|nr:MAG: geranylgeranylglyceryl/heptaprenylglyceryl phosphate synthase [Candidatus Diapherotrites archaeon]